MDEMNQEAVQAMLEGFNLLLKEAISNTTKIYDGFVIGQNGTNWNVRYNGQVILSNSMATIQ